MTKTDIEQLLRSKRIGFAGCGGLGSNAAVALVRIGLKQIVLADFDQVEESNLNRQYFFRDQIGQRKVEALKHNLLRIHSDIQIDSYVIRLNKENTVRIFAQCDIVIEAFDQASAKAELIETFSEKLPDVTLIVGNGIAGYGGFDNLNIVQFSDRIFVCGDGLSEISEQMPPLAPRVSIVAGMQANLAVELLVNQMK